MKQLLWQNDTWNRETKMTWLVAGDWKGSGQRSAYVL